MPVTMKDFGIDRLSAEDRLDLMHEIWDSLAVEPVRPPISDARRLRSRDGTRVPCPGVRPRDDQNMRAKPEMNVDRHDGSRLGGGAIFGLRFLGLFAK